MSDPELIDLIAADPKSHTWGHEYENAGHEDHTFDGGCKVCRGDVDAIAARALLVVEQHTNRRVAELETENRTLTFSVEYETRAFEGWKIRAEKVEATIASVRQIRCGNCNNPLSEGSGNCVSDAGRPHIYHEADLRAALGGEQQ